MGVIDFSTKKYLFINMRFHKYTVANYIVFSQVNGLGIIMSKFVNNKFPTFRCFEELLLQQNVKKFCDKWQFCPLLTITNRSFCELCLNLKDKRQSRLFFFNRNSDRNFLKNSTKSCTAFCSWSWKIDSF